MELARFEKILRLTRVRRAAALPFAALRDWALPPRCVVCSARGSGPGLDLCADCEGEFPPAELSHLGLGLSPEAGPHLDRIRAAFDYAFPVAQLVRGLKFSSQLHYARVLGVVCARRLQAAFSSLEVDWLLPVPLHRKRLKARGFNQAYELAKYMGATLALPVNARCAARVLNTKPQTLLAAPARRRNLDHAFCVSGNVGGARVAIIDDVVTTGATVRALARALKLAGAVRVEAWAVAYSSGAEQVIQRNANEHGHAEVVAMQERREAASAVAAPDQIQLV